jgi:hypothetical protein
MPGFLSLNVLRSALRSPAALACVLVSLLTSPSQAGLISGHAFVDYDGNGTVNATEYGIPGITVTAYTPAGTSAGSTTTLFTGTYSLNASGSGPYRVEFSSIPSSLSVGFQGASGHSEVRFVPASTASNLNLTAGGTTPNLVVAKIGVGGLVCLFTQTGTHLIADINGYYTS